MQSNRVGQRHGRRRLPIAHRRSVHLEMLETRWLMAVADAAPASSSLPEMVSSASDAAANETASVTTSSLEVSGAYTPPATDALFDLIRNDDLTSLPDPILMASGAAAELEFGPDKPFAEAPGSLFPDQVAATDPEQFPWERLGQEFLVFDNMGFPTKPNLVDDYGFQPSFIYNQFAFWAPGEDIFGEPNLPRIREFAKRLDPRQLFIMDVEHLPVQGTDAEVQETVRKLNLIVDTIKEANPLIVTGIYRIPPNRDFFTPVSNDYGSPPFDAWQASNDRLSDLVNHVDVILPSVYAFYPDYNEDGSPRPVERDRWLRYATTNLLEARRYNKPIISYVWPAYHGGGGSDDPTAPDYRYWKNKPIGGDFWKLILETTYNYSDGMVFWSASETSVTGNPPWWQVTTEFMDSIVPARATGETTVAGTISVGSYLNTRSNDLATVRVTVNSVNDAPVAKNDTVLIAPNSTVTLNVLADNGNGVDSDVDSPVVPGSTTLVTSAAQGTLVNLGSGNFRYTPNANFQGTDRFNYSIQDAEGLVSNTATFAIVVNSNPVAVNDTITTNEDVAVTLNALTSNGSGADADIDGNLNTQSHIVVRAPAHGSVTKLANGAFRYTPATDYHGADSFTYTIKDLMGATSNEATVSINVVDVNDAPSVFADNFTLQEDVARILGVLGPNGNTADFDRDGTLILNTLEVVTAPKHGVALANPDGTFRFQPARDYSGTDSFTYRIKDDDGRFSNAATVNLNITAVNDAPQAYDDVILTQPGMPIDINVLQANGKQSDVDVDSTLEAVRLLETKPPQHGRLDEMTFGSFRYTPNAGFRGTDRFQYVLYDQQGANSRTATVTVMVNNAPVAQSDLITVLEDSSSVFSLLADNGSGSDFDPERSLRPTTLTILSEPTVGTLVNLRDGRVRYTPPAEFSGDVEFTYRIADNYLTYSEAARVTLRVASVNDAPIAQDDTLETRSGHAIVIAPVEDNGHGVDLDVDGFLDLTSLRIMTLPVNGVAQVDSNGTLTYQPNVGFVGTDTLQYRIADDQGTFSRTALVEIHVVDRNVAPVARADYFATYEDNAIDLDVLEDHGNGADIDRDGQLDVTELRVATNPAHGVVVHLGDGRLRYQPNPDYFGNDSFSYTIRDTEGATSTPAVVTLLVESVNDAPRLKNDLIDVPEDGSVTFNVLLDHGNGADLDVDGAIVVDSISVAESPLHGNLELLGNGEFRYTPTADFSGNDQFRYRAADSEGLDSELATVTLRVQAKNDPPVAFEDVLTTNEDIPLLVNLADDFGQGMDFDPDGATDPLQYTMRLAPLHGTASLLANGQLRYTPEPNFFGEDYLEYQLTDIAGQQSQVAAVRITVNSINDVPVAGDDRLFIVPNQSQALNLLADHGDGPDTDVEDVITHANIVLVTEPGHGQLTRAADGSFTYTPASDFNGLDSFQYTLVDAANAVSSIATVTLVVNFQPTAQDDTLELAEDTSATVALLGTATVTPDIDLDGVLIVESIVIVTPPAHGQLTHVSSDIYEYTPLANFSGTDSFTYTVADDDGQPSEIATVQIVVAPTADAPVALPDQVAGIEGLPLLIDPLGDPLNGGDYDPDEALSLSGVQVRQLPQHGSVQPQADGRLLYIPSPNYNGVDTFSYTVSDATGLTSNEAMVTIQLSAVNYPPVSNDDEFVMNEDGSIVVRVLNNNGLGADLDLDGSFDNTSLIHATFARNGGVSNRGDGSFRYTPVANFFGVDYFTYKIQDNKGSLSRVYEGLRESLDATTSQSRLNHEWQFDVGGTGQAFFNVTGFHTSRTEAFRFEYSTDRVTWHDINVQLTNASQTLRGELPAAAQGNVYIRLVDTDRTPGDLTLDQAFIDEMYIQFKRAPNLSLPEITISDVTVSEDSGSPVAQFVVSRTGPSNVAVVVGYETFAETATAGADFVPLSIRALPFAVGENQKTISVPIVSDAVAENEETFGIQIRYITGGNLHDAVGRATVLASDTPPPPASNAVAVPVTPPSKSADLTSALPGALPADHVDAVWQSLDPVEDVSAISTSVSSQQTFRANQVKRRTLSAFTA